jgi:hypothetical protein
MEDTAPNGHFAWNAVLLAAVAAGCGWLVYSQFGNRTAIADGARDIGRSLKQGFGGAGSLAEGVVERVQNLTGWQRSAPIRPSKVAVDEPMAGYGA